MTNNTYIVVVLIEVAMRFRTLLLYIAINIYLSFNNICEWKNYVFCKRVTILSKNAVMFALVRYHYDIFCTVVILQQV